MLWKSLGRDGEPEASQRRRLVAGILRSAPRHPPGERYEYSNAGFAIAGAMLEHAAGTSFPTLLRERLFMPLGMTGAGFGAPATAAQPDQPLGHRLVLGRPVPVQPGPGDDNPAAITPAGRVHATILDFARYATLHLGRTPAVPLDPGQLAQLHAPVPPAADYALGWQVLERPWAGDGPALTHSGTNTMFYTVMWLAPARGIAAVAACNLGGNEGAKACDQAVAMLIRRHAAPARP
jgi:CubicO group peptidase (beta-lactamase class C family)